MTFLSYPTALLLLAVAVIALAICALAPPRQVRGVLALVIALATLATVIDLVVALR